MKTLRKLFIIFLALLMTLTSITADAHPGRLDARGGHWNHKTGTYHYHRGPRSVSKRRARRRTVRRRRTARR
ncbi:MAG: YHYH domain-containing protein, partial [Synergistaceae bacterium]|nr:YHYH domain-containing protein [Synergistaceae bacterium]